MPKDIKKIKHYTIPIFIPHAACPFQCIFCNQKKITGHLKNPTTEEIKEIVNAHLTTFPDKNVHIEIGFFGGSFTAIPFQEQEEYLKIASYFLQDGKINGIRISTRPDFIDENIISLLKRYGVSTIELGAQSMDKEVLEKSGRGHAVDEIIYAAKLIKRSGLQLGLQMMIGLPSDTLLKSKQTANKIIDLEADCTRIYPTLVIKNTILETYYNQNMYTPLSLDEAVEWTKELYLLFLKSNTKVIRIGLHPSEGLTSGDSIIAGPFHPSFKELVMSKIWKDILNEYKFENESRKTTIYVAEDQLNFAIGHRSLNKKDLIKKFTFVQFKTDSTLKGTQFYVNYH